MSEFVELLTRPDNPFGMDEYEIEPMSLEEWERIVCNKQGGEREEDC